AAAAEPVGAGAGADGRGAGVPRVPEGGAMTARAKRGWLVVLGLVAWPAWGAAPPVPSGKLTAAQQKRLGRLAQDLDKATHAGRVRGALGLGREAEALRRRWQGARHWRTIDARYAIERWERLARLSEADQKEVAVALRREAEGRGLQARRRYAEAE